MYQLAPNLTLLGLLDIIALNAEMDQNDKTRYISAQLAKYSKSASQHLLDVMASIGNTSIVSLPDLRSLIVSLVDSQFGTAGQAIIEKVVGFPRFAKLPAEIRTMIHALPDPRTIRITSMITYNNIWGDPNDPLIVLRSVCKESLDVVTRRYQMIPYSNLGSVTTVKPRLTPDNRFVFIDVKQDVVYLKGKAVKNCVAAWNEREETRQVFNLTKYSPEPGFNLTSLSLSADSSAFSELVHGDKGRKWLTGFTGLRKIVLVEVEDDHEFRRLLLTSGGKINKQLHLRIIWEKAMTQFSCLRALRGVEFEFVGFTEPEVPLDVERFKMVHGKNC
ncbi:uncharacterized protein RAG0_06180 [Rhynchosporium agropyri]|uniref:2EXR domain-containing protein n=1 Tax=Rhynchosporium agropyri TaxID=914238 RepID=A0A1E1KGA4_9HELO|nr:uncharacterized protein RAG0_06180 [Rhynchosporium agropyri]